MKRDLLVCALVFCTIFQLKAQWTGTNPIYTTNLSAGVGIGTSTPSQKLQVYGGSLLVGSGTSANANSGIKILAPINSTHFNWQIAANSNVTNAIEITPSSAVGGTTFNTPAITILSNGNIGIGRNDPGSYKLNVWGTIRANEVVVNTTGADFVFATNYKLLSLPELDNYINSHKHLPDLESANLMEEHGLSVGDMQTKLLQKLEEITLYVIELNKTAESQKIQIEALKQEVATLKGSK
jgi:hypothetical protein